MSEYGVLVNELSNFLKRDDVVLNENVISAFDLYHIINDKLKELIYINTKSSFIPKDYVLKIYANIDDENIKLDFYFIRRYGGSHLYIRNINKNKLTSEFTFNDNLDLEFMRENECEIKNIFDIKEKYYNQYRFNRRKECKLFTDDFFDFILSFNEQGEIDIKLRVNNNEKIARLSTKHWYLYFALVRKINKNKIDILKKFSININDLNDSMKLMIEDYLSNNDIKVRRKKV